MGYCMDQDETKFTIKAKNKHKAWEATRPLLTQQTGRGGYGYSGGQTTRHYSWVDMDDFKQSKTLEGVLEAWRWEPDVDEKTGDIVGLHFRGEKFGDDPTLFRAIAPYVETGSFITMNGEDGNSWTWKFEGGVFSG